MEIRAYDQGYMDGWEAGIRHVEEPLTEIWERRGLLRETDSDYAFVGLLDDIGDLLDFLEK